MSLPIKHKNTLIINQPSVLYQWQLGHFLFPLIREICSEIPESNPQNLKTVTQEVFRMAQKTPEPEKGVA